MNINVKQLAEKRHCLSDEFYFEPVDQLHEGSYEHGGSVVHGVIWIQSEVMIKVRRWILQFEKIFKRWEVFRICFI